jgi:hypothetical protein
VDKFIGDALFCVFATPRNALDCAVAMHCATEQLNATLVAGRKEDLVAIGIGVHHGLVVAGVLGDTHRLTCTLIASDVNLASRLEGLTKAVGAKTLASKAVIERVEAELYDHRFLGPMGVQGATEAIEVYEVFQNDPLSLKGFKTSTKAAFEAAVRRMYAPPKGAAAKPAESKTLTLADQHALMTSSVSSNPAADDEEAQMMDAYRAALAEFEKLHQLMIDSDVVDVGLQTKLKYLKQKCAMAPASSGSALRRKSSSLTGRIVESYGKSGELDD